MTRDYQLKVRLEDDERDDLLRIAGQLREPVSMIVRRALRQYVDQLDSVPDNRSIKKAKRR